MTKTVNLGKVVITPKGEWSASSTYEVLDVVFYDQAVWIAKKASVGQTPTAESEYWSIALDNSMSARGIKLNDTDFAKYTNYYDSENQNIVTGYIYDGSIVSDSKYITTDYIEVEPEENYCFSCKMSRAAAYSICQYDSNKGLISSAGRTQPISIFRTASYAKYIRVSFLKEYETSFTMEKGETPRFIGKKSMYYIPEELVCGEREPMVFLPDEIYVASGRTIEIYNKNVCPAADKYHFKWTCAKGKSYKRKFSISATNKDKGDYPLRLEIINDRGEIVFQKTVNLRIVYTGLSDAYVMCPIGDTHTAGRYWIYEMRELSYGNIVFDGTLLTDWELNHEGRVGWTSTDYTTKSQHVDEASGNMVGNPFWSNNKFSWAHYVTANGKSNISAVQLFFGEREFLNTPVETVLENLKTMITSIRQSNSTLPIFVVLPPCWGSQDGMALETSDNVDFSGTCEYDLNNTIVSGAKFIYENIKSQNYTNVFFVPLTSCYDSEYNFEFVEKPVNPRSSKKELVPSDVLCASEEGYLQMADVMFSAYCVAFMRIEGQIS